MLENRSRLAVVELSDSFGEILFTVCSPHFLVMFAQKKTTARRSGRQINAHKMKAVYAIHLAPLNERRQQQCRQAQKFVRPKSVVATAAL
jgi:hypothetical protein